jgi:methyl-accepting chemotaxis protein
MDIVARQISERSTLLSRGMRLESARFVRLSVTAASLGEQIRQAHQTANQAILSWQRATAYLQHGQVSTQQVIELANMTHWPETSATATAETLAYQSRQLGSVSAFAEEIARRAARVSMTVEVQTSQFIEQMPALRAIADELRSLSIQASEATQEISQTITEVQTTLQQLASRIATMSLEQSEANRHSRDITNEMNTALKGISAQMTEYVQWLNDVRAALSHAQVAEEMSRIAQESGSLLQKAGSEDQQVAESAERLLAFDNRLMLSLQPFKLSERQEALTDERDRQNALP